MHPVEERAQASDVGSLPGGPETSGPDRWHLVYDATDPAYIGRRETLCTVGNGYFATRGAAPEDDANAVHHPGTYVAGVYNRLATEIGGRKVENESIVNVPNWLPTTMRAQDGAWLGSEGVEILDDSYELDMFRGVLWRRARLRDEQGRTTRLTQRRFASMRDRHVAALETTLVPENWSGRLELRSGLDGSVRNNGVARYADLDDQHLGSVVTGSPTDDVLTIVAETTQSRVRIAEAARTQVHHNGQLAEPDSTRVVDGDRRISLELGVDVEQGDEIVLEKVVTIFTSRDEGITEPLADARDWATDDRADFGVLLERHVTRWRHMWGRMRIEFGADGEPERLLHVHLFHVLQTVSNNSIGTDVGVPARGLHGEAYRGHVFWDELFVFPFLSLRFPQLTAALLLYRYRRLDQARRAAIDAGRRGAMFPWQSASNGREETQTLHLNPVSGRWLPDASHLQRHVNAAIAVNIWQYYQASGDLEFLRFYGAELMLEIARFWVSAASYNHGLGRYEILGVMGPDEYHEAYPDREVPGLDNNSYTNLMAVWCICRAFDVLEILPPVSVRELCERLDLTERELDEWGEVSRRMRVCFHDGVLSQFEGYEDLAELDWERYRRTYGDIQRLDRILEAEGDSPNRYRLAKQPDTTMLFYVLSADEVKDLLVRLGYQYDPGLIPRTIEYYDARTAHGSTLSRVVDAWVHARLDRKKSWDLFIDALRSDTDDLQGGTTAEGIHLGAMAGTIDLLQRCYPGVETRDNVLRLHPMIPDELVSLSFDIRYRGHLVFLEFTPQAARVRVDQAEGAPIDVEIEGVRYCVRPGESIDVPVD